MNKVKTEELDFKTDFQLQALRDGSLNVCLTNSVFYTFWILRNRPIQSMSIFLISNVITFR